jgi:hypothetical protein
MKYYEIDLNEETIKLRLTSELIMEIEKKNNKSILEIMKDVSQTNIIMLLMYMRRFEMPNFSQKEASQLYDKFIDNEYSMQDVVFKVIYEGLVVSGVMTKGELSQLKEMVGIKDKEIKKKIEELQN